MFADTQQHILSTKKYNEVSQSPDFVAENGTSLLEKVHKKIGRKVP
ncbi:hypothetical protein IKG_05771 [Bacillus cereus VD200]|nr:hypothetical protein IKG_05771 [Bacillus cereus VD200]